MNNIDVSQVTGINKSYSINSSTAIIHQTNISNSNLTTNIDFSSCPSVHKNISNMYLTYPPSLDTSVHNLPQTHNSLPRSALPQLPQFLQLQLLSPHDRIKQLGILQLEQQLHLIKSTPHIHDISPNLMHQQSNIFKIPQNQAPDVLENSPKIIYSQPSTSSDGSQNVLPIPGNIHKATDIHEISSHNAIVHPSNQHPSSNPLSHATYHRQLSQHLHHSVCTSTLYSQPPTSHTVQTEPNESSASVSFFNNPPLDTQLMNHHIYNHHYSQDPFYNSNQTMNQNHRGTHANYYEQTMMTSRTHTLHKCKHMAQPRFPHQQKSMLHNSININENNCRNSKSENNRCIYKHRIHYRDRKKFHCTQCRYVTDRKNNLMRHIVTMHQESTKALECCGVAFQSKSALREHNSTFHSRGYRCQICSRNFCRKALLRRHLAVHSGKKDYYCKRCGYATSHKSNLERHQKVHDKRSNNLRRRFSHVSNNASYFTKCSEASVVNKSREVGLCPEIGDSFNNTDIDRILLTQTTDRDVRRVSDNSNAQIVGFAQNDLQNGVDFVADDNADIYIDDNDNDDYDDDESEIDVIDDGLGPSPIDDIYYVADIDIVDYYDCYKPRQDHLTNLKQETDNTLEMNCELLEERDHQTRENTRSFERDTHHVQDRKCEFIKHCNCGCCETCAPKLTIKLVDKGQCGRGKNSKTIAMSSFRRKWIFTDRLRETHCESDENKMIENVENVLDLEISENTSNNMSGICGRHTEHVRVCVITNDNNNVTGKNKVTHDLKDGCLAMVCVGGNERETEFEKDCSLPAINGAENITDNSNYELVTCSKKSRNDQFKQESLLLHSSIGKGDSGEVEEKDLRFDESKNCVSNYHAGDSDSNDTKVGINNLNNGFITDKVVDTYTDVALDMNHYTSNNERLPVNKNVERHNHRKDFVTYLIGSKITNSNFKKQCTSLSHYENDNGRFKYQNALTSTDESFMGLQFIPGSDVHKFEEHVGTTTSSCDKGVLFENVSVDVSNGVIKELVKDDVQVQDQNQHSKDLHVTKSEKKNECESNMRTERNRILLECTTKKTNKACDVNKKHQVVPSSSTGRTFTLDYNCDGECDIDDSQKYKTRVLDVHENITHNDITKTYYGEPDLGTQVRQFRMAKEIFCCDSATHDRELKHIINNTFERNGNMIRTGWHTDICSSRNNSSFRLCRAPYECSMCSQKFSMQMDWYSHVCLEDKCFDKEDKDSKLTIPIVMAVRKGRLKLEILLK